MQHKPKGNRKVGHPEKIWKDQLHLDDQRTGTMPKPSEFLLLQFKLLIKICT